MTIYLFKYCLPVLLGYTLFVGLSGRMNPLVKPEYPEERPSWLLGLWTGLSVTIVTLVGLHMAYSMTLEGARKLLPPTALFLAVLLVPGFLAYFHYRRIIATELQASRTLKTSRNILKAAASAAPSSAAPSSAAPSSAAPSSAAPSSAAPSRLDGLAPEFSSYATDVAQQASHSIHNAQDNMRTTDTNAPIVATFLDSADLQTLDSHQQEAANNDSALYDPGYIAASDPAQEDFMDDTIFEEMHYSALDLDEVTLEELSLTEPQSSIDSALYDNEDELLFEPELMGADEEMNYLFEPETMSTDEEINTWFELGDLADDETGDDKNAQLFEVDTSAPMEGITDNASFLSELELLESDLRLDEGRPEHPEEHEQTLIDSIEAQASTPSSSTLDAYLSEERSAHQETSRQLSATRELLATLTSGAEGPESDQAASFLQMRDELSQSRSQHEALEALVQEEASKRLTLESTVTELQRNLIISKQEVRRSTAARAKALGTANKAIAFARQTLQVRALLEEELDQVRETLTRRQSTISSLIKELEHEKERTQEEVSFMVQQLVLHEQQLKARRNLEDASDSFDSRLPAPALKRIETQTLSPDM